jgi:2-polyprenyl-3-methyl-5-hydroxy-6-metoxy-1,4-benzoquinol methylase
MSAAPQAAIVDPASCWCGADAWARCFRTRRFGLLRCAACGTHRLDPRPLAHDGGAADLYDRYYRSAGASSAPAARASRRPRDGRFWRVAARVPGLGTPRGRALDVGCGDGHLCGDLLAAGWHSVAGVDVARSRLERAREAYPGVAFHASLEGAASDGAYDLVVLDNVIEHLPEPAATLAAVRAALRATGDLVVITPNMRSGNYRLLGRRWTPELAPEHHVYLFTEPALVRLLRAAGFAATTSGSFHVSPYSWRSWWHHARRADLRVLVWRAMQQSGALYARLVGAGPMLYVVARPAGAGSTG